MNVKWFAAFFKNQIFMYCFKVKQVKTQVLVFPNDTFQVILRQM